MSRVGATRDARRRPVTCISYVKLTRAISASLNTDARVLDVTVSLALNASHWDANVLAHVYKVIVDLNATC